MSNEIQIDNISYLQNLRKLPAKKRLDAIFDAPDPEALVHDMNAHELLMTIEEVGGESALELLELMQPEQVRDMLDLSIWDHDRIMPEKAGEYLSLLFEANSDKAVLQIDGLDIEFIGLIFKLVADIYDTSQNEEPNDSYDICSKSPGGRFIICFSEHPQWKGLAQAMYNYIEALYGIDMKRALTMLEQVRFELASGLEEATFRFRNNRLLDLGIMPHEERLLYFSPLSLNQIKGSSAKMPQVLSLNDPSINSPLLPIVSTINDKYPFLKRAVHEASEEEAAIYRAALTHASLNMHAALSSNFADIERLNETVSYVKTLTEFGLIQASQGSLDRAYNALHQNDIRSMIRLGRSALVNMRKQLLRACLDESYLFGQDFGFADSPLREVARAISLSEPRYYEGLLDVKKLTVRFFSTIAEVHATLKAIAELEFRAKLLGPLVMGCTSAMLKDEPNLSHAGIYARSLINAYLKVEDPLAKITDQQRKQIFTSKRSLSDDFLAFAKNYAKSSAQKFASVSGLSDEDAYLSCAHFSSAVLAQLEQNPDLLLN